MCYSQTTAAKEAQDQEKLVTASVNALLDQCIQAFFKINCSYYIDCAYRDCEARGMAIGIWHKTLRDGPNPFPDRQKSCF